MIHLKLFKTQLETTGSKYGLQPSKLENKFVRFHAFATLTLIMHLDNFNRNFMPIAFHRVLKKGRKFKKEFMQQRKI